LGWFLGCVLVSGWFLFAVGLWRGWLWFTSMLGCVLWVVVLCWCDWVVGMEKIFGVIDTFETK
jgi:hypothetical protein